MRATASRILAMQVFLAVGLAGVAMSTPVRTEAAPQLTITTVAVVDNQIRITGANFGSAPAVTLADSPLSVVSNSDTDIVAETPYLAPGMYILRVSREGGATPETTANTHVVIR